MAPTALSSLDQFPRHLVTDYFPRRHGRGSRQRAGIFLDPLRCHLVGFLNAGFVLKEARREHRTVSSVREVVPDEPRDRADQRHEHLVDMPSHLAGIGYLFVTADTCVHGSYLRLPIGSRSVQRSVVRWYPLS